MTDTKQRPAAALAVLMAATFIFVLDFFIVNVAIPATQSDLHASDGEIQLVVTGYAIALASGLIVGGRLGDLIGRRRALMLGLALFTVASAVCGVAALTGRADRRAHRPGHRRGAVLAAGAVDHRRDVHGRGARAARSRSTAS